MWPTSTPPTRRSRTPRGRGSTRSSRPRTSTSSTSCRRRAKTSRVRRVRPSRTPSSTSMTSSSRRWTRPAPNSSSRPRSARSRSTRARRRSTSRTRSATRSRTSTPPTCERLYELVPGLHDVVLSVHCHDDLGLAVANSFAGLRAGARQVECAVNGIGERAGNASLEEIVMLLHTRQDEIGLRTGAVTTEIARTSRLVSRLTGLSGPAQQGDRRAQRVRARVGDPPGRGAQGAHDLRDHGRDDRRARRQLDRARQALGSPRARPGAVRARASSSLGRRS